MESELTLPLGMHVTLLPKAPYLESSRIDESYGAMVAQREEDTLDRFSNVNGQQRLVDNNSSGVGMMSAADSRRHHQEMHLSPQMLRSSIIQELSAELQNISVASQDRTKNYYNAYSPNTFQSRLGIAGGGGGGEHIGGSGDVNHQRNAAIDGSPRRIRGSASAERPDEPVHAASRSPQPPDPSTSAATAENEALGNYGSPGASGAASPSLLNSQSPSNRQVSLDAAQGRPAYKEQVHRKLHEHTGYFTTAAQAHGQAMGSPPNLLVTDSQHHHNQHHYADHRDVSYHVESYTDEDSAAVVGAHPSTPSCHSPPSSPLQHSTLTQAIVFSETTPRSELMHMIVTLRSENAKLSALIIGQGEVRREEHAAEEANLRELHEMEVREKDSELLLLRDEIRQHEATIANLFQLTNTVREENTAMLRETKDVKARATRREADLLNLIDKLEAQLELMENTQQPSLSPSPARGAAAPLGPHETNSIVLVEDERIVGLTVANQELQAALEAADQRAAHHLGETDKLLQQLQGQDAAFRAAMARVEAQRHEERAAMVDTVDTMAHLAESLLRGSL